MTDEEICDLMRAKWPLWEYDPFDIAKFRLGWEARGKRDIEIIMGGRFLTDDSPAKQFAEQCALAIERGK